MGQPIPIGPALKGLNTLTPFIDFESGYARELTNYGIVNGSHPMRPAVRTYKQNTGLSGASTLFWFDPTVGTERGIVTISGNIINIATGAVVGTIGGAIAAGYGTRVKHKTLDLLIGAREPRGVNNPFTAWTFTTLTITATAITSACSHNGRLYISDGTKLEYSTLGSIGGEPMKGSFAIADFMEGQTILRMFSLTMTPGNDAANLFVVFGVSGKVLIYQGLYPADPNWTLIGNYTMPAPNSKVSFLEKDGDIFVGSSEYAYWIRDLVESGPQGAFEKSPSAPIQNFWRDISWSQGNAAAIHYYAPFDAILCNTGSLGMGLGLTLRSIADYRSNNAIIAYFRRYKAWAVWFLAPYMYPIREGIAVGENASLFSLNQQMSVDNYVEDGVEGNIPIETSWKTPFYYPQRAININLNSVKPYFYNTLAAAVGVKASIKLLRAIYDLTDYNALYGFYTQESVVAVNPGIYTSGSLHLQTLSYKQYTNSVGLSGNGAGVSIQFTQERNSGSTASQTMGIYQASMNLNDGAPYPC